jgi:hypothetical protein
MRKAQSSSKSSGVILSKVFFPENTDDLLSIVSKYLQLIKSIRFK